MTDLVDYDTLVKFMWPLREDVRWDNGDGDVRTLRKLRRICSLARSTGTLGDFVSAAQMHLGGRDGRRGGAARSESDSITPYQFEALLRNCWLDLTDDDIRDVMARLLPVEDGGYSYLDFLCLCEVDKEEQARTLGAKDTSKQHAAVATVSEAQKADVSPTQKQQPQQPPAKDAAKTSALRDAALTASADSTPTDDDREDEEGDEVDEVDEDGRKKRREEAWIAEQEIERKRAMAAADEAQQRAAAAAQAKALAKEQAVALAREERERDQRAAEAKRLADIQTLIERKERAARAIQAGQRGRRARQEVQMLRQEISSAKAIQAQARGRIARRGVSRKRQQAARKGAAASTIQAQLRGRQGRARASKARMNVHRQSSAVKIQARVRSRQAKRTASQLRAYREVVRAEARQALLAEDAQLAHSLARFISHAVGNQKDGVQSFRDAFARFDSDGSGVVSDTEFVAELRRRGFGSAGASEAGGTSYAPDEVHFAKVIRRFDANGDGQIDYGEFVEFLLRYGSDGPQSTEACRAAVRATLALFAAEIGGVSGLRQILESPASSSTALTGPQLVDLLAQNGHQLTSKEQTLLLSDCCDHSSVEMEACLMLSVEKVLALLPSEEEEEEEEDEVSARSGQDADDYSDDGDQGSEGNGDYTGSDDSFEEEDDDDGSMFSDGDTPAQPPEPSALVGELVTATSDTNRDDGADATALTPPPPPPPPPEGWEEDMYADDFEEFGSAAARAAAPQPGSPPSGSDLSSPDSGSGSSSSSSASSSELSSGSDVSQLQGGAEGEGDFSSSNEEFLNSLGLDLASSTSGSEEGREDTRT